jgi:glycosyltransferase involved in cell wall biosynthesis
LRLAFLGDPNSFHFRRWVTFFAQRGHHVTLLVPKGLVVEPPLPTSIAIEAIHRFRPRSLLAPISFVRSCWSVRRAVGRVHPDILNAHFLTVHGWQARLAGFHPFVVTLWGSDVFVAPRRWRAVRFMAGFTLRSADLVMANSEALLQGGLALGAPRDRSVIVQWGVDMTRFSPGPDPVELRRRLGLDGLRVVFSPRLLQPIYRQEIVIAALAALPSDVVVVMTARLGTPPQLESLRDMAKELDLTERVLILPEFADADMADVYRLAEVVITVPASDSTPSSILEALACGCQIVASDLPSVREWLFDLDPEALVPVDDAPATAAALTRALRRNTADRAEIGRRGRAIVAERADEARSLAAVEELYMKLSRASSGKSR